MQELSLQRDISPLALFLEGRDWRWLFQSEVYYGSADRQQFSLVKFSSRQVLAGLYSRWALLNLTRPPLDIPVSTVCFSELKRRQKAEQKAKEKAAKEEALKEKGGDASSQKASKVKEEEISPNVSMTLACVNNWHKCNHYWHWLTCTYLTDVQLVWGWGTDTEQTGIRSGSHQREGKYMLKVNT